ncbi:GNAT family N-acetyltransferase [uncultured Sphaerochaeta sp.]|uniref:GNAT family N-acetyltransferase n=1 Tax=uncultured Sphaerochaeta sp. TaxID=886478 RepID=UPI002A0A8290|nr:GNAT family N-acetyltransferase [uncultured Sphaerochaeta sp.]
MNDILEILITDRTNADFLHLVTLLDAELDAANQETHQLCNQYNTVDKLLLVVLILVEGIPAACGACKEYDASTLELKRIFVKEEYRGKGLSKRLLAELERQGKEHGYSTAVLETGKHLKNAMALYSKLNYKIIPSYGPYKDIKDSICMKKELD